MFTFGQSTSRVATTCAITVDVHIENFFNKTLELLLEAQSKLYILHARMKESDTGLLGLAKHFERRRVEYAKLTTQHINVACEHGCDLTFPSSIDMRLHRGTGPTSTKMCGKVAMDELIQTHKKCIVAAQNYGQIASLLSVRDYASRVVASIQKPLYADTMLATKLSQLPFNTTHLDLVLNLTTPEALFEIRDT